MNNENWDLICSYTADQAIEDGVLVKPNPKAYPNHLITNALHHTILEKVGEEGYKRAIDVLFLDAALTIMPGDEEEHLWTDGLEGNVTGKTIWMARNELGGLTLMFPEDY